MAGWIWYPLAGRTRRVSGPDLAREPEFETPALDSGGFYTLFIFDDVSIAHI